jgi:hypothetical protein
MIEIFRATNPAQIALLKSVFASTDVKIFIFDDYTNSLGAGFSPSRFMVLDGEYEEACKILKECELEPPPL